MKKSSRRKQTVPTETIHEVRRLALALVEVEGALGKLWAREFREHGGRGANAILFESLNGKSDMFEIFGYVVIQWLAEHDGQWLSEHEAVEQMHTC